MKDNVRMFVAYALKGYWTNFDEGFRDWSYRYQKSLESGLNHTRKYTIIPSFLLRILFKCIQYTVYAFKYLESFAF